MQLNVDFPDHTNISNSYAINIGRRELTHTNSYDLHLDTSLTSTHTLKQIIFSVAAGKTCIELSHERSIAQQLCGLFNMKSLDLLFKLIECMYFCVCICWLHVLFSISVYCVYIQLH